jgi:hypothetical protein
MELIQIILMALRIGQFFFFYHDDKVIDENTRGVK